MSDDQQVEMLPAPEQVIEAYLLRREEAVRAAGDAVEAARAARAVLTEFMRLYPHAADALARLPDHLREPFLLRYFAGWQIESDSPTEPSISRHLNVTPRTVRNRLRDAEANLRRWREGN